MASPEQRYEQIREFLQEATLRDYPNPDRRGCHGSEVLRNLAAGSSPRGADWEHVTHCSPCYREFLEFRAAVLHGEQKRRKHIAAVVASIVLLGGGLLAYRALRERDKSPVTETRQVNGHQSPVVSLFLRPGLSRSVTTSASKQVLVLPAKPTLVRLLLNSESDPSSLHDVVLQTVEGRDLLRLKGLPKQILPERGSVVALDIPSTAIKPGAYVLLLYDHDPLELRNIYNLQVVQ